MKKLYQFSLSCILLTGLGWSSITSVQAVGKKSPPLAQLTLPVELPEITDDSTDITLVGQDGKSFVTTLNVRLQRNLEEFIKRRGDPIASVVVVEVKTGRILALAQGRTPNKWGATVHTGLYSGFPAASIFKVVPTAAALEVVEIDPTIDMSPPDRCANVNPHGLWLRNFAPGNDGISLESAFAHSCNSFFAKLAVQYVGMGLIEQYADKFRWGRRRPIPSDFYIPASPIDFPVASESNIQTVGRFAAGFGRVGLSTMHAAWVNLVIANDGRSLPLLIKKYENGLDPVETDEAPILDAQTSWKMRQIMHKTALNGTARSVFHRPRYRELLPHVGGKTGTLTSPELKAQVTWFVGPYPYENPKIIVSSVVVINGTWHIRGADLAAEALKLWLQEETEKERKLQALSSGKN